MVGDSRFFTIFDTSTEDIAWSDLLTEAVYSTHLREKPDQGPSCSDGQKNSLRCCGQSRKRLPSGWR